MGRDGEVEEEGADVSAGEGDGAGGDFGVEAKGVEQGGDTEAKEAGGAKGEEDAQADADAGHGMSAPGPDNEADEESAANTEKK